MSAAPSQSPVNVDQNRAAGQDSPAEGSGIGREAHKASGYPGTPDIGTNAAQSLEAGESVAPPSRPGDDAPEGTPNTGEVPCPACGGSGRGPAGKTCPECNGTGEVTQGIGGG